MLEAARWERFTFYLLDVIMPGMDGMKAAREIRGFDAAARSSFSPALPALPVKAMALSANELRTLRDETLPVSRALRKEVADRWLKCAVILVTSAISI